MKYFISILFLLPTIGAESAIADQAQLVSAKSSLAVVTGREGLASGLAHRHVVVARDWTIALNLTRNPDAAKVTTQPWIGGTADISIPVKQLLADDIAASELVRGLMVERGIWNAEKDQLDPSNQAKVTENMLDESQLDGEHFPKIAGAGSFGECRSMDPETTQCTLDLKLTVRGVTVTKKADLTLVHESKGKVTTAKFTVPFKFTDFAIKPYSAMLGAIRVSDEFLLAAVLRVE